MAQLAALCGALQLSGCDAGETSDPAALRQVQAALNAISDPWVRLLPDPRSVADVGPTFRKYVAAFWQPAVGGAPEGLVTAGGVFNWATDVIPSGGQGSSNSGTSRRFNPTTNIWEMQPNLPAINVGAAAWDGTQGLFSSHNFLAPNTYVFDAATGTWVNRTESTSCLLAPGWCQPNTHGHALSFDGAGVIAFGGDNAQAKAFGYRTPMAAATWRWAYRADAPTQGAFSGPRFWWTKSTPTVQPAARNWPTMAYDSARGKVVLFGGATPTSGADVSLATMHGDTWEWTWSTTTNSGSWSLRSCGAYLNATATTCKTSCASDADCSTGNTCNGSRCSGAGTSPPARLEAAMAFDVVRGKMVLFGGRTGSGCLSTSAESCFCGYIPGTATVQLCTPSTSNLDKGLADVWEWDGTTWTNATPTSGPSPSARTTHAMASPESGGVYLFGGRKNIEVALGETSTRPLSDIWKWDGTTWAELGSPAARRAGGNFHYDETQDRLVLMGGMPIDPPTQAVQDVWTFTPGDADDDPIAVSGTWHEVTPWNVTSQPGTHTGSTASTSDALNRPANETIFDGVGSRGLMYGNGLWQWDAAQASWQLWSCGAFAPASPTSCKTTCATDADCSAGHSCNLNAAVFPLNSCYPTPSNTALLEFKGNRLVGPNSRRDRFAMAYDPHRKKVVIHGGFAVTGLGNPLATRLSGDTWSFDWDPASPEYGEWTMISCGLYGFDVASQTCKNNCYADADCAAGTTCASGSCSGTPSIPTPGNRSGHRMVYDTFRQVILLHGADKQDWELDLKVTPATWTKVTPACNLPTHGTNFSMTYDSGRNKAVLLGGIFQPLGCTNCYSAPWEWDSANRRWQQSLDPVANAGLVPRDSPSAFPKREFPGLAYDAARAVTWLFSGPLSASRASSVLADLWTYAGATNYVEPTTCDCTVLPCDDNDPTTVDGCDAFGCTHTTSGSCPSGYTGDGVTCTDNDECALNTDNCDVNAACTNTPGSFTCACNGGYTGDGVTCSDTDECALNTDNCDANAVCSNTPGSFTCACQVGYAGNGVTCTDTDECALNSDNCDANAACANTPGSFTCACNGGYTGDGVTCTDTDECALNSDNCDANAACANTPGSFTCACNGGYTGDGVTCTDIDECALNTDNCHVTATCINTPGSFVCACNGGPVGSGVKCPPGQGPVVTPPGGNGCSTSGGGSPDAPWSSLLMLGLVAMFLRRRRSGAAANLQR